MLAIEWLTGDEWIAALQEFLGTYIESEEETLQVWLNNERRAIVD
jgi:hypothetical protein